MARLKRRWCIFLLLQFFSVFALVQNSSGAYTEQYLESPEVCSSASLGPFGNLAKKKIRLGNFGNNTVKVRLTRWPEMWAGFLNFRCRFQVSAPTNHGVMVIIQQMHLRTKKASSFNCQDYIKFEQNDGLKTGQICGEVDASDTSRSPARLLGPRFFYDNKGQMDITFATGDKEPEDDSKPISLSLIFTAYSECSSSALMAGTVRQCSSLRTRSCISSGLSCDGVINCGFTEDDFGSDERDCNGAESKNAESFDNRSISIYVFAITSIATLVIVVVFVLIICCCLRKFSKRPGHPGGLSPRNHHHQALEFHLDNTGPPSAPPPTHLERLTNEKRCEDLPPPYDALFPTSQSDSMKK